MFGKIFLSEVLDVAVVSTCGVEPEDGGTAGSSGTSDSKLNPILDGSVSGHAHSPDIASLDVVSHVSGAVVLVNDGHSSGSGHLESLSVRSVLLGFLGHKSNVGDVSHSLYVKLSILSAVVDDGLVDTSVTSVRNASRGLLALIVFVPGGTSITDDARHGGIDDHIGRDVKVGDSLIRVTHE